MTRIPIWLSQFGESMVAFAVLFEALATAREFLSLLNTQSTMLRHRQKKALNGVVEAPPIEPDANDIAEDDVDEEEAA